MKRFPKYKGPIQYINREPYQICAIYPIVDVKNAGLVKDSQKQPYLGTGHGATDS